MKIEAILFVNWIFWAALSAGSLLVVGLTEVAGGTTRGYRLFMAGLLVAFAAILVVSDLALPAGVAASTTEDLRRPLTFAFAAGSGAYLVASIAQWRGSAWLAIATGLLGACAVLQPSPGEPWPIDPSAAVRPGFMVIDSEPVEPGQIVSVTYSDSWDRGVLYAIDALTGAGWERLFLLISDANRAEPRWYEPLEEDLLVPMVGVAGTGPDHLLIPDTIKPGTYRICTGNTAPNICAAVTVVDE